MKIDLHLLQNFAPSNLNRDDTGSPKDCEFGGVRRARISSQCLKRAIRQAFADHALFGDATADLLAARTKRLVDETAKVLAAQGKPEDEARLVIAFALQSASLKVDEENKTQYLLFLPRRTIQTLATVAAAHWDKLREACKPEGSPAEDSGKKRSKSAEKKAAKDAVPREVAKQIEEALEQSSRTPDLALFGRMIADNPDWNVDAACQVAHALSTNRVSMEFDFYTAVDDFRSRESTGSDMMGTIAFQSSCFYRYACLDVGALGQNLGAAHGEDVSALTRSTVNAFLRASALAIPTGKQSSMAAQNRPSYMLALVRRGGTPQSLANAFVKPVRSQGEQSLVESSVEQIEKYLDRSLGLWGDDANAFACAEVDVRVSTKPVRAATFDAWVADVVAASEGGA
jgi:CRISPR system Cascade subunit CasC